MPASKAQQKAVSKYMKENYDVYQIRMKKGQKEAVKAHASDRGESVNGFITRAIQETIALDSSEGSAEAAGSPSEAGVVSLPPIPSKPHKKPQRPQERPCQCSWPGRWRHKHSGISLRGE